MSSYASKLASVEPHLGAFGEGGFIWHLTCILIL
jgi:hypothetical protein